MKSSKTNTNLIQEINNKLPDSYSIEINSDEILMKGPFCNDLNKRLKRLKGYWDGLNYKNRRLFVIPLNKIDSLPRIICNWNKEKIISNKKEKEEKIKEWLSYVEEEAKKGVKYQKGIRILKELGIDFPEYSEFKKKLDNAIILAKEISNMKYEEKLNTPSYGQSWNAQKPSYCSKCNENIEIGELVHYRYFKESRFLEHVNCSSSKEKKKKEAPYTIGGGSGYGYQPYCKGQILKSNKENLPEFLYVVRCDQKYFKYDGMSFGVGDDSGYIYTAHCRVATDEEALPLKIEIENNNKKKALEKERNIIIENIKTKGIYQNEEQPEGDRFSDRQNIYGGGDWFITNNKWIWYIQNNGMDGDDWSHNNVRTGGAGAIGWRIPFNKNTFDKIREIDLFLDKKN